MPVSLHEVTLPEMLEARERRLWRQMELRKLYPQHTMVCFTMNIAGPVKNSPLIHRGFLYGCSLLRRELVHYRAKADYEVLFDEPTGNEGYWMIGLPPVDVKRITAGIEDNDEIGRLFDMDVLDQHGRKLDRTELRELNLAPRTCLICGLPAKTCARSRTHSVAELQARTKELLSACLREHDLQTITHTACRALLYEVCTTPKPGLVDRANSGSHRDMDVFTFLNSSVALQPYFRKCAEVGMDTAAESPEETFRQIRKAGLVAERDMLHATGGVNTHKGAIFSMGIACAALGRLNPSRWSDPDVVLSECGKIAAGVAQKDFDKLAGRSADEKNLTVGEKLYLKYGIRGVRGQAEDGFPAVSKEGLRILERELACGADLNRAGSVAMLAILCADDDTNLIARGGREQQILVTRQVEHLLKEDPSPSEETIRALDRQFIGKNLSPGGSADLLGLCYLLHFMKDTEF